jgi:rSAM/selenodomain-associated transferase 1
MESAKETRRLIIVFYRNPRKGKVKTRLAISVGEDVALKIHLHLSMHTNGMVTQVQSDKVVFYDHEIVNNDFWETASFQKCLQSGNDLGERMFEAFNWGFSQGYKEVLIIGTDCPGITPIILESAFDLLINNDAVIGPAADGGYYLLGIKKSSPDLFNGIDWGSDVVFKQTTSRLDSAGYSFSVLQELRDIDRPEDLDFLKVAFPALLPAV